MDSSRALFLALFFFNLGSHAAVINWVGSRTGEQPWNLANNWNPNRIPGTNDDVRIVGDVISLTVRFIGNAQVRSLVNEARLQFSTDVGNFTQLISSLGATNRGVIVLDSPRSDRSSALRLGDGAMLENHGTLLISRGGGGGRRVSGGLVNFGQVQVEQGIGLEFENRNGIRLEGGSAAVLGSFDVVGGAVRYRGGAVTGAFRMFNSEVDVAETVASTSTLFVLGADCRLVGNRSESTTIHLTTDVGNFTTLRTLPDAVNRGRIILGSARTDRHSRLNLEAGLLNDTSGVIEIRREEASERNIEGRLVNRGTVDSTEIESAFRGTYQAAGGRVVGPMRLYGATIIPSVSPPVASELLLHGATTLVGNVLENMVLRVISDVGSFSVLRASSNVVNRGVVQVESQRSDRATTLDFSAGLGLVNRGRIRVVSTNEGGRVLIGAVENLGDIEVDPGTSLEWRNSGKSSFQRSGNIRVQGRLDIEGGRFDLLGGVVTGLVQALNVDHFAADSMTSSVEMDVLGAASVLRGNLGRNVTYRLTSNVGNFTTLTTQPGSVNVGRILLASTRSDRSSRLNMPTPFTNTPAGLIEVIRDSTGGREIEGHLVNQGRLVATNRYPANFNGTYQVDGGMVEGQVNFVSGAIYPTRDVPRTNELVLFNTIRLLSNNLPNLTLRVLANVGSFSTLVIESNLSNHGTIILDSERSDRHSVLRGVDGVIRNSVGGLIVSSPGGGGGARALTGSVFNQGRIRLLHPMRWDGAQTRHINSANVFLNGNELEVAGDWFLNGANGRILGSGGLRLGGTAFTNAGGLVPGSSPGRITVTGNYVQAESGSLDVELAGAQGPGTGHDILQVVQGNAVLQGGLLSARLLGDYVPDDNALFRVLSAERGLTGRFSRFPNVQVYSNRYLEMVHSANALDLRARAGSISIHPPAIAFHPESLDVDVDAPAEFRVVVNGTGPFTFQWRRNGVAIPGATSDRLPLSRVRLADLGNYDVVVQNPHGSTTSQSARLGFKSEGPSGGSCNGCDFGDAPDSYGTSLANDGARHPNTAPASPFVGLGPVVDTEGDSFGNSAASLDDTSPAGQGDDEDGVLFTTPIVAGQSNEVRVFVRRVGYEYAFLNAWLDMGDDGDFNNGDDHIIPTMRVFDGLNTIRFWVPSSAVSSDTISRFRLVGVDNPGDPKKNVGPKGAADNGEVEDHPVTITGGSTGGGGETGQTNLLDFGDAPNTYRTTLAANGARHRSAIGATNNPSIAILGARVDLETNGTPSVLLTGDDFATPQRPDDEDGVTFPDPFVPGNPSRILVTVTNRGFNALFLNAWIDYGRDGSFSNAIDRIVSGLTVTNGLNTITVVVPNGLVAGTTAARFRLTGGANQNSTNKIVDYVGEAPNGEVEDHLVTLSDAPRVSLDFGDAPESQGSFVTRLTNNGPRHVIVQGFHLGTRVDAENDGQPTAQARGDDNNGNDDEDGVVFTGPLTQGGNVSVEVTASAAGRLEGWIDFNGNRSWADAGEDVFRNISLVAGVNTLNLAIPPTATVGEVFARFRFSSSGSQGLVGQAQDGEVEDYKVKIETSSDCDLACTGSDFWLAFPGNQFPDPAFPLLAQLRILGTAGTTVNVEIPGIGTNVSATIAANGIANVVLPNAVDLGSLNDSVLNRGIHVTAGKPVSVYAISRVKYSSDGYLGLPTDVVGTEYVVGAYPNLHVGIPELSGSQFVITATRPNTTVTITPSYETGVRVAKVPYVLVLTNAGDCYQLRNTNDAPADLTGTLIESDQPVSVFGGHQCTDINSSSVFYCDYLVEQIPPVNRLGSEFFTAPFMTRTGGDTIRVVASRNNTTLTVDGSVVVLTNKGDVFTSFRTNATWVSSDKPVYAAQYASSSDLDGVTNSDPFMVTIPGRSLFSTDHNFVTAGTNFPTQYINVIAPTLVTSLTLDGTVTNPVFTAIGSSGFRYARMQVAQGFHSLTATRAIGVTVYGWNEYESYAWPACLSFGDTTPPVIRVATNTISRTLPANENVCTVNLPDLRPSATVTDNCQMPLDVILTQTPPVGTQVGVGTNNVTLSVRDAAGNTGTTIIHYVVVDSRGGGAYTITCPADIRTQCESTNGAIVRFVVNGSRGCSPVTVETIPASGSLFPRGTTEVVARIVVEGVIQAECRFEVTVNCKKRIELRPVVVPVGQPRRLILDFDEGDSVVEVADQLTGPWTVITGAKPGLIVEIAQERGKFYRIR